MADRYGVRLTLPALADLAEIGDYHARLRGLDAAEALVETFREHAAKLDHLPLRGPVPKELRRTGRTDARQTALGRYRIFWSVTVRSRCS